MKKYVVLLLIICCTTLSAVAQNILQQRVDSLLQDPMFETSQIGIMVYDLTSETVVYQKNERQLMRPASCMKLVTAITALDCLGGDYEYTTRICYTGNISEGTLRGDIYCVGGFDPMLTTDDVAVMAESVKNLGIERIEGNIIGDRTMKEVLDYGEGWCWDDKNPLLIPLSIGRKDIFLETFARELSRQGIDIERVELQNGITPTHATLISTYRRAIDDILHKMMKDSDNFFAESMFYQTAASTGHRLAKASDARNITRQLIKRTGLGGQPYKIADGSGLSLYNYVSAELLTMLLRYAFYKNDICAHLLPSLPIAGVDGTLKKRMTGEYTRGNVCAKTGTVTGISSLAGYLTTYEGHQLCFAIINQGVMRNQTGRDFQDRVCEVLCRP